MATRKPAGKRAHADIDAASEELPAEGFEQDGLFVFDAQPVIRNWPAGIRMPVAGGGFQVHEVRLDLLHLDVPGLVQLHEENAAFFNAGGKPGQPGDPLLPLLQGWSGFARQGMGEMAYSDANKGLLLANAKVRSAVFDALNRLTMGIEEKNSETLPGAGQLPVPNRQQRRAAGKLVQTALKGPAKGMA